MPTSAEKIIMGNNNNQRGFVLPLVIAIVAILAIGGTVYLTTDKKVEAPVVIDANVPSQTPTTTAPVVGGDRDIHGCIGSAGYSWCQVKNKCLRVWEEKCEITNSIPSIIVKSPNGGEVWKQGSDQEITWTTKNILSPQNVSTIYLINEMGTKYYFEGDISKGFPNIGVLKFVIPASMYPVGKYKVYIETKFDGQKYIDESDDYFRIITPDNSVACTMDAYQCPDGSYVGRSGLNCEFVCPVSGPEVKINQSITTKGITITPLKLASDSRCPRATKCVWAGTVEVQTKLSSEFDAQILTLTLGSPVLFGGKQVTLTKVLPEKTFVEIQPSDYVFTFVVTQ